MKKYMILAVATLITQLAYANNYLTQSLDFVAPVVTSTGSVDNNEIGLIVYDASAAGFYGRSESGSWINLNASTANNQIVYVKDIKASGIDGGSCTSGSYITRTLNTLENPQSLSWISLSSNQFTLDAGTYEIHATVPGYLVNAHKAILKNISNSSTAIVGSASYSAQPGFDVAQTNSVIEGVITITSAKTFEIQHRCQTTRATNAFGQSAGFGDSEVYTQIKIRKL